jgi:tetrahydromethanopterin S-methyltransferase subunit B
MLPYQDRVIFEKEELDERLQKLEEFVQSPLFSTLDPAEQERLMHQSHLMEGYLNVLIERIENF